MTHVGRVPRGGVSESVDQAELHNQVEPEAVESRLQLGLRRLHIAGELCIPGRVRRGNARLRGPLVQHAEPEKDKKYGADISTLTRLIEEGKL